MTSLKGAARSSVLKKLDRLAEAWDYSEFDRTHDLIAEPGRCEKDLHDYCGCEIHQAWCPCMSEYMADDEVWRP